MLRLNMADPAVRERRTPLGLVAGDAGRLPQRPPGRRRRRRRSSCGPSPGLTIPLVDPALHAGRRRQRDHGRDRRTRQPTATSRRVPLPRARRTAATRPVARDSRRPATRSRSTPTPRTRTPGQGSVLLDIGGDVGALVVAMPASMVGVEVEIRPGPPGACRGAPAGTTRTSRWWPGRTPGGVVPSLVFARPHRRSLPAVREGHRPRRADGRGRRRLVTEASWPGAG